MHIQDNVGFFQRLDLIQIKRHMGMIEYRQILGLVPCQGGEKKKRESVALVHPKFEFWNAPM